MSAVRGVGGVRELGHPEGVRPVHAVGDFENDTSRSICARACECVVLLKWLELRLTQEIQVLEHLRKRVSRTGQEEQSASHLLGQAAFTCLCVSDRCSDVHLGWILVHGKVTCPYSASCREPSS